ncbi:hypothetical protein R1sor_016926 [Riccia sorocarpa]|uniref:Uncharacterized protein n=1 Tax=Riccia sorocarpa TaxID=122646 RepID=A0ABD3HGG5_9MARC
MLEVQEEDIPVAVDQVPPSSAIDDVTMDDNPVDVRVASVPASDHEVEDLVEAMDVLDSQVAVLTTTEATTGSYSTDSAVAEMTMGENLVEIRGASEPAYDHEVEKGKIFHEVVSTTSEATTVEVLIANIPFAAVQAPPTSAVADVTMGENLMEFGGAFEPTYDHKVKKGQIFSEAVPTTLEAQETAPSSPVDSTICEKDFTSWSRSPSPEAPRRIQPERKGKKKMDEGEAANMEHKGKWKVDEQSSIEPTKKKKRSDDSDEDSNESTWEQGEAVQYTHFAELGKNKR